MNTFRWDLLLKLTNDDMPENLSCHLAGSTTLKIKNIYITLCM